MTDFMEFRWHGRGGQGTVTAAKLLAETMLGNGKYVQAFPEYGPERMGAPVKAYNRISDHLLTIHCQVTHPKVVIVVDPTLIGVVDILEGVPEDGIVIINTPKSADEMRKRLKAGRRKVYTVDATKISIETLGRPMPNTPMLGALARATNEVGIDALLEQVRKNFSKKFNPKVIEANIKGIERAYQEVQEG
ncbi:MAG: pyruvate synthase [Nitrospinae bacterium RIFCSPLOWO2_12_FULL_45_22]|nr:MAG: pyruvate synthase [Nitrospinae bacterium RIFCSPLOWO2_12_FULL_45_22]